MFKKFVMVAGLMAMMAAGSFAQIQNARIGALGGVTNIEDISNIYLNPAYANSYKNDIQVSFNNDVIGIKGVGDNLVIGAAFNTYMMMVSDFYTQALLPNVALGGAAPLGAPVQRIPHILLGIDANPLQLGFDMFHEYRGIAYHTETTTAAGTAKTDIHKSVMNPGLLVGLNINTGSVPLSFLAGFSLPMIDGSNRTVDAAGVATTDLKVRSGFGLMLRFGIETSAPINNAILTIGAKYQTEHYRFETVNNLGAPATIGTTDTVGFHFISPYIGIKAPVIENIMLTAMEKLTVQVATTYASNIANTVDHTTDITFTDTICLGAEKSFQNILFLDSLAVRGGFTYPIEIVSVYNKVEAPGPTTTITYTNNPTMWGPAYAYLGIGGSFGPCTIDLLLNPAAWAVAIGGPQVARCTATLNF